MKGIQQKSYGEVRGSFEAQVDKKLGKPKSQILQVGCLDRMQFVWKET